MKIEVYEQAMDLYSDLKYMEEQLKNRFQWITVSTENYEFPSYSKRFQKELFEWLSLKQKEYQKEFDELD